MALSETRETFGAKSGETWPLLWVAVAGKKKKKKKTKKEVGKGSNTSAGAWAGRGLWGRALSLGMELPAPRRAAVPCSDSAPRGAGLFMARSLHAASFQAPRGVGVLVPFPCLDKVVFR